MVTAVSPVALAAGASADVSWFPHIAPQTATPAGAGVIVDQFLVDSKTNTGAAGSVNLTSGVPYLVTAQGTYSLWNAALEVGSPNADAIFPSATGGRTSLQVGLDPECSFAFHDEGTGFTLGHETFWQFNNGAGFTYVTPQGGPYATPQTNYLYRYTIVGTGVPLSAKVNEAGNYADNYGKIQVTVYSTTGSGTGGGGGSLVPPDGSDHSILRVESGIPGWEARPNIAEADFTFTDIATANVSNTKHGLAPKNPNDATKYLDGTGAYSTPAGSTPLTTKGDLFGFDTANARIPVGSNGQVLQADSTQSLGVKWGAGGAGTIGYEFDYVELNTGTVNITHNSDATADTVITGSSVSYDGSTVVLIEVFFPAVDTAAFNAAAVVFVLYDGSTDLGRIGVTRNVTTSVLRYPVYMAYRITPSNASHQYIVKAFNSGGTGIVYGGAAGAGVNVPGFLRITRVA